MINIALQKRLILALDVQDAEAALDLVRRTRNVVGTYKVGLELFCAVGPSIVKQLRKEEVDVFLDLKLHDIPNTVAGAVRSAAKHEAALLTVHASGGLTMLQAAQQALSGQTMVPGASSTQILAVTALTNLTGKDLAQIGFEGGPDKVVERLVMLAKNAGVYGCVCSPEEASMVRQACGADFAIVTPGIRPKDAPPDDQKRTATAAEAIKAGADYVVVGRPIRTAPNPADAAARVLEEIADALAK
jgi:orotidine-5'-phosphate decarboxylase